MNDVAHVSSLMADVHGLARLRVEGYKHGDRGSFRARLDVVPPIRWRVQNVA